MIDPDSVRTEYSYDELNRLETLTFGDGQQVAYEYFPDGLKKQVTNPNGTISTYLYDAADRTTEISHVGPVGTISSYQYFYDPNSNRERQVEHNAGRTETTEYTYDFVNRLKTVTYPDRTTRYEYDQAGNRIQEVSTGAEASDKTFHYDAINRLERITDTTSGAELSRYAYDENGNTTSKTAGGITTNFLFDIKDQLGEVRQGTSVLGRYGYDYQGRRILKIGDDGRRQYTYDQLSVITEADQVNSTVSKYDYGMDQLVRLDNRNEGRSFFHLDGLRSTVSLTDGIGVSRQSIFYDAWGNERDRIGASANNFTFTGHELDEETGLIYAKARFYDAEVGRFLSQDSFLGEADEPPSLHRYSYAFARPTFFQDPDGHAPVEIGYVYVIRGVDPTTGEAVSYTGSTIQELKARFGSHKWKQLIKAETTTIDVQKISAEVDVASSRRGTLRSAKLEAVRSPEEATRKVVAEEPPRPLNKIKAATQENAESWYKRHNVEAGKSYRVKGGVTNQAPAPGATATVVAETGADSTAAKVASESAAASETVAAGRGSSVRTPKLGGTGSAMFTGLVLIDAYKMAREEAKSRYVEAPYLLEDEGGVFMLESAKSLFSTTYQKHYVKRDLADSLVPIKKKEFYELKDEAKALWGYLNWKNEWVPGKLRKELPVIDRSGGVY